MLTRLGLALIWLLHFLPLERLAPLGEAFGGLLYAFGRERRHIALTNLRLCYPQMGEAEREQLARAHFRAFGRRFLERQPGSGAVLVPRRDAALFVGALDVREVNRA